MAPTWTWNVVHAEGEAPSRVDRLIVEALSQGLGQWIDLAEDEPAPEISRSQVQKLLEQGRATADGKPIRSSAKLNPGTELCLDVPPATPLELMPEDRPLEFLYQDEHVAVVNKPPGLTVHPSETQATGTLVHALLHHVRDLSGIGGVARPGIVHRLDKDTSGALIISKTDAAHRKLSEVFAEHTIERRYWALVFGDFRTPNDEEIRIETTLGRSPKDRKKMAAGVPDGRRAVTWLKRVDSFAEAGKKPFASLVEARLETGRTHQVRVHLTEQGHSLLGDPLYGKPSDRHTKWLALPKEVRDHVQLLPGQALHARILALDHPIHGTPLRFEAPLPEQFRLLWETLRRYR